MPVAGAFARVLGDGESARSAMGAVVGVSTFAVNEPGVVGIVVESDSLDDIQRLIERVLPKLPGVIGVCPVYMGFEDELSESDEAFDASNASSANVH